MAASSPASAGASKQFQETCFARSTTRTENARPQSIRSFSLLQLRFLPLHQFHIQAERLQFAHKHVERFGNPWLDARFALDDGLVNLCAAIDIVRLCREQLLQNVR